jgi:hypothetical protein
MRRFRIRIDLKSAPTVASAAFTTV